MKHIKKFENVGDVLEVIFVNFYYEDEEDYSTRFVYINGKCEYGGSEEQIDAFIKGLEYCGKKINSKYVECEDEEFCERICTGG